MDNFLKQLKLHADTNNENGDAVSYLMGNWGDFRKEELAHIAVEAMIAAERQLKDADTYIAALYNGDIAQFYGEMYENLAPTGD